MGNSAKARLRRAWAGVLGSGRNGNGRGGGLEPGAQLPSSPDTSCPCLSWTKRPRFLSVSRDQGQGVAFSYSSQPRRDPYPPSLPLGSPSLCSQLAGVEAGYACFCGSESDLARGRPAPATDCDQICFGHPGQLCGGDGRLGIFRLFELADSRDRLELRDVSSGNLLRAFDGAHPPPPGPLRLRTAALLLTFRSDARGHAQGFALTYRGEPGASPSDAAHTTALLATSPHTSLRRAAGYSGGQSISRGFN